MKYIGNFAHNMDHDYIKRMISLDPDLDISIKPNQKSMQSILNGESGTEELMTQWHHDGFDISRLKWYHAGVERKYVPIDFPGKHAAWFAILPPGSMIPTHYDPVMKKSPEFWTDKGYWIKRFWIACCDWVPWHFFYHESDVLTGYRLGDVYEFDKADSLHGSANVGATTKMTMQLTVIYNQQDLDVDPSRWELFRQH